MQMDADFRVGLELLKRFREQIRELSSAKDETQLLEIIEAIKEPLRNATYRIKQGRGPMKEELFGALAVIVREIREFQNPQELKESAKRVLELLEKIEAEVSA
ncbi:MAG: hypothetical protein GXO04_04750 [Aquificae bacterium]|nr:hypothetical protein [Aquificota bacterium]